MVFEIIAFVWISGMIAAVAQGCANAGSGSSQPWISEETKDWIYTHIVLPGCGIAVVIALLFGTWK